MALTQATVYKGIRRTISFVHKVLVGSSKKKKLLVGEIELRTIDGVKREMVSETECKVQQLGTVRAFC